MNSRRNMNSHDQPEDLIDLSLRHSLKNWATHKDPPANGRDRLLAAVQEEKPAPRRKPSRFNFDWFFGFQENQEALNMRPIYGYRLESVYSLKANMALF